MATSSKRVSPPPPKRAVKPPAKRPSPDTSARPFLRLYHSPALRKKTLSVVASLEQAPDPASHRDALADVVVELTNAGLDYCFTRPLGLAKVGFLVQQSANLGLAGAQQVMGSVIRNIIGRMDRPQLLSVSSSIREMML